jgi:hypothetical protein
MLGPRGAASGTLYLVFGGRFPAPGGAGEGGEGRGRWRCYRTFFAREYAQAASLRSILLSKRGTRAGVEMTYAVKREDKRFNLREREWKPRWRSEHAPPRQGPTHLTWPFFLRVGS